MGFIYHDSKIIIFNYTFYFFVFFFLKNICLPLQQRRHYGSPQLNSSCTWTGVSSFKASQGIVATIQFLFKCERARYCQQNWNNTFADLGKLCSGAVCQNFKETLALAYTTFGALTSVITDGRASPCWGHLCLCFSRDADGGQCSCVFTPLPLCMLSLLDYTCLLPWMLTVFRCARDS